MFHEESAKLDALKKAKYSDLRKYHWSIRNFRNWSAHNQFSVDPGEKGSIFNVYEKEYFEHEKESAFDFSAFQNKYQNAFNRHLTRVQNLRRH